MSEVKKRLTFAKFVVQEAGMSALKEFTHWKDLAITEKGAQDFVSEVDKATERFLRANDTNHQRLAARNIVSRLRKSHSTQVR